MSPAGLVTVCGSHHYSLEACFAAVRKHRKAFGDAPITINLHEGGSCEEPQIAGLPVIDLAATIANRLQ
uniref:hypothetical protein n=1 Tax=Sphingomonas bacterium TaxID=1895847 RepID=UPI00262E81C0|nr:hypothetical protein [Sphingomonas bacterium]